MAAPTTPTITEIANAGRNRGAAEALRQFRRVETARGGTSLNTPTYEQSLGAGYVPVLARIVESLRRIENLYP